MEMLGVARDVSNHWSFLAVFVICGFAALIVWINKSTTKNRELIAEREKNALEREKSEEERTKARGDARDRQFEDVWKEIRGVGSSLDRHKDEHKERDIETVKSIESIDNRLCVIEGGLIPRGKFEELQEKMHNIDLNVREIYTVIKERLKS